jgi:hypothetical protein
LLPVFADDGNAITSFAPASVCCHATSTANSVTSFPFASQRQQFLQVITSAPYRAKLSSGASPRLHFIPRRAYHLRSDADATGIKRLLALR